MAGERRVISVFMAARPHIHSEVLDILETSSKLSCVGTATDGELAISQLPNVLPDIALIDFALPGVSGVKVAEFLAAECPGIVSVLMSDQESVEHYRRAMLAGARDFITWPIPGNELDLCLERVTQITDGQRRHAPGTPLATRGSAILDSRIIVLAGGKGGVGTSFLAANLAHTVSINPLGFRTALVDFDLVSPDLAAVLNVEPQKHLTDLVPAGADVDPDLIGSIAHRVEENLDFFPGPQEMDLGDGIPTSLIPVLLECWRGRYDIIVVDLGTPSSESARRLLSEADLVIPVLVADVLSIRAASRLMRFLERLGLNETTIQPVVNARTEHAISFDRISGHIGASVMSGISASDEVRQLLDEGRLAAEANDAVLRQSVETWTNSVLVSLGMLEGLSVGR